MLLEAGDLQLVATSEVVSMEIEERTERRKEKDELEEGRRRGGRR